MFRFVFRDIPSPTSNTKGQSNAHFYIVESGQQRSSNAKRFQFLKQYSPVCAFLIILLVPFQHSLLSITTPKYLCVLTLSTCFPFYPNRPRITFTFLFSFSFLFFSSRNMQI